MEPVVVLAVVSVALGLAAVLTVVFLGVVDRAETARALRTVSRDDAVGGEVRRRQLAAPVSQRVLFPVLQGLSDRLGAMAPSSVIDRLDQELVHAGSSVDWDGERLLAVKTVAAALFAALGFTLAIATGSRAIMVFFVAVVAGAIGYYLPEWAVRSRAGRRQAEIRRALPDALDLLSITVEAGLGFDAAVDRVAREIHGPLGGELYRMVQEMRLGRSRSDALRDLGDRSSVDELRSFVLAMIQAEIFGISIAKVLHVQAHELRIKRRQFAEEQAQKLPVKILFPLLFGVFPALFVVLLGPAVLQIYDNIINR